MKVRLGREKGAVDEAEMAVSGIIGRQGMSLYESSQPFATL